MIPAWSSRSHHDEPNKTAGRAFRHLRSPDAPRWQRAKDKRPRSSLAGQHRRISTRQGGRRWRQHVAGTRYRPYPGHCTRALGVPLKLCCGTSKATDRDSGETGPSAIAQRLPVGDPVFGRLRGLRQPFCSRRCRRHRRAGTTRPSQVGAASDRANAVDEPGACRDPRRRDDADAEPPLHDDKADHCSVAAVMLRRGWMIRYMPQIVLRNVPEPTLVAAGYTWAALLAVLGLTNLFIALRFDFITC